MKIVQINSVLSGSTGGIARSIAELATRQGHRLRLCVPKGRHNAFLETTYGLDLFGSRWSEDSHILLSRLTGFSGCFSWLATRALIRRLRAFAPDVVHLHNLHNAYIHLPLLFSYIKENRIPVVWTLHDCWAFTGHCPHFTDPACHKWKTGCGACSRLREYPVSYVDRSGYMWQKKRSWFTGVSNLQIVTPSCWLADLVKQSFLREYPVRVLPNGIDLTVFQPAACDFREKHGLEGKYLVLGVANGWDRRKGLDVFCRLAQNLGADYQILLVGTDEKTDSGLPKSILSIPRTRDPKELAGLYSAADVFVNPTREDTFPTVNLEALACGTPVVTFRTGGSPEMLDESCGKVVEAGDISGLQGAVETICRERPFSAEACRRRAEVFHKDRCAEAYLELYEKISLS